MENTSQTFLVTRSGKKYSKTEKSKKRGPTNEIELPKPKQRKVNQTSEQNKPSIVQSEAFAAKPAPKQPHSKPKTILTKNKYEEIPAEEPEATATKENIDDDNYDSFTDSIDHELLPQHFFKTEGKAGHKVRRYFQQQGEQRLARLRKGTNPLVSTKFETLTEKECKMIVRAMPRLYDINMIKSTLGMKMSRTNKGLNRKGVGYIGHMLVSCDTHDLEGHKIDWENAEENLYSLEPPKYHNGIILELKLLKGGIVKGKYYKNPEADNIFT